MKIYQSNICAISIFKSNSNFCNNTLFPQLYDSWGLKAPKSFKIIGKIEKNPPILFRLPTHSILRKLSYILTSSLLNSPTLIINHGRVVFFKENYRNKYFCDGAAQKCEFHCRFPTTSTGKCSNLLAVG